MVLRFGNVAAIGLKKFREEWNFADSRGTQRFPRPVMGLEAKYLEGHLVAKLLGGGFSVSVCKNEREEPEAKKLASLVDGHTKAITFRREMCQWTKTG